MKQHTLFGSKQPRFSKSRFNSARLASSFSSASAINFFEHHLFHPQKEFWLFAFQLCLFYSFTRLLVCIDDLPNNRIQNKTSFQPLLKVDTSILLIIWFDNKEV